MSRLVVLNLGKGNWQNGFPTVTAEVWESESRTPIKMAGSLPATPDLLSLYRQWRSLYKAIYDYPGWHRRGAATAIEFDEDDLTQVSGIEFGKLCKQLRRSFNGWLDSGSFGKIERQLRTKLNPSEEIHIIIETEDEQLRRLPWHLWNFFEDYPLAEVALSTPEYGRVKSSRKSSVRSVRILAILGNSQGIDVEKDRALLNKMPGADIVFLVEPTRLEVNQHLWEDKGWDILFFAGHSSSQEDGATGQIEINPNASLTVPQLRNALKTAIARGLKFAIFNSCDGLGLARELADLRIPQLIVMREPVPDRVAQEFLKEFLSAFSSGKSFYLAVREAKEKLQGLEDRFPAAWWLPLICQNPTADPPTWQEMCGQIASSKTQPPTPLQEQGNLAPTPQTDARVGKFSPNKTPLWLSLAVAGAVIGARLLGLLQPLELSAFDRLMRLRPPEGLDPRLLIVKVTAEDVRAQPELANQGRSLSSRTLEQLLETLNQHQPRVVGLDIYRDFPVDPKHSQLIARFREDNRFISICGVGDSQEDRGTPPSPDIPTEIQDNRVGFSDVVPDPNSGIIRRHLLGQDVPIATISPCQSRLSFSFLIALRYLYDDGFEGQRIDGGNWQVGKMTLKILDSQTAGYHQIDDWGDQILLNYRSSPEVARQVTLGQVLRGEIDPSWVRDRVVLIGTSDRQFQDLHLTPYNPTVFNEMPGIVLQAHMVSQLLSAVKDRRPLLWWLPKWGERLWIVLWSGVGGAVAWRLRSLAVVVAATGVAILALCAICYLVLSASAGWIPLIPPLLALVLASGTVAVYRKLQKV